MARFPLQSRLRARDATAAHFALSLLDMCASFRPSRLTNKDGSAVSHLPAP